MRFDLRTMAQSATRGNAAVDSPEFYASSGRPSTRARVWGSHSRLRLLQISHGSPVDQAYTTSSRNWRAVTIWVLSCRWLIVTSILTLRSLVGLLCGAREILHYACRTATFRMTSVSWRPYLLVVGLRISLSLLSISFRAGLEVFSGRGFPCLRAFLRAEMAARNGERCLAWN